MPSQRKLLIAAAAAVGFAALICSNQDDASEPARGSAAHSRGAPLMSPPRVRESVDTVARGPAISLSRGGFSVFGDEDFGADDHWLAAFPESQRARAEDSESIVQMLQKEVLRLFPVDEERILVNPDGSESIQPPLFDSGLLQAREPILVESRNHGDEAFDHLLVAFKDGQSNDIALIVTCLVRDGVVVPAAYSMYQAGQRPPRYPFLTVEDARSLLGEGAEGVEPVRIFYRSPVSPTPLLFVYEFTINGELFYVSQDEVVWRSLDELNGPFSK